MSYLNNGYVFRRMRCCSFIACIIWSGAAMVAQPKIIIKLDDLEAKTSSFDACLPTFDSLSSRGIKAGWGVMRFAGVTENQIATLKNYLGKTDSQGDTLFEIWHHGLDHSRDNPLGTWEFSGTSYEYQKARFDSASRILKNKLGITVRTFGAPYNQTDATLLRVMSEDPNMKVLLLGQQTPAAGTGIINLTNRVNMESATGVVNFDYFVGNYNAKKSVYKDYMVLQGHPPQWTTAALREEFKKIITFLLAEGCEFVTPYEYYRLVNPSDPPAPVQKDPGEMPRSLNLFQNYPNPFNPSTTIEFTVPGNMHTVLTIFNSLGQQVATLYNEEAESGTNHLVHFDASDLAGGVYISRLACNGNIRMKKLLYLK